MSVTEKNIAVLGEGPIDELDDTTITAEAKCSVNITRPRKIINLSLHHNRSSSSVYANSLKNYQFKAKDSEKNHIYSV